VKEQISADPQTRELAWQRHTQKLNENSELSSAERKGREEGRAEGEKKGREEGEKKGRVEGRAEGALQTLQSLRDAGILSDAQFEEQRRKLLGEDALS
jgi:flagellar biosynthesis/type III secretory pathway protein FliH